MVSALALNCTLKPSPQPSSTDKLADEVLQALQEHGVTGEQIRVVDLDVKPGVEADMGDGDAWPSIRARSSPPTSWWSARPRGWGTCPASPSGFWSAWTPNCRRREGRPVVEGKVAVMAVLGNEDAAHKITADIYQALADVGFSIPSQGGTYWNGEAMHTVDYKDLDETPERWPVPPRPWPATPLIRPRC